MINLLVIGGGNAGKRYIEACSCCNYFNISMVSFDFLGKTRQLCELYDLPCISYQDLFENDLYKFDCIVLCVPIQAKYDITKQIINDGYHGALIVEKPLALSLEESIKYGQLLQNYEKFFVGYAREFIEPEFIWPHNINLYIQWPSVFDYMRDSIIHDLPHILDWMFFSGYKNISLNLCENTKLIGTADGFELVISFHKSTSATLNGQSLPSLDHRKTYPRMIKNVLTYNSELSRLCVFRSQQIAKVLCELRI